MTQPILQVSGLGKRFGGFVALYGRGETIALIEAALARAPSAGASSRSLPQAGEVYGA